MHKSYKTIHDKLVELERTAAWLARHIGESPQLVNHWKNRGVPANKTKKIAAALGMSRKELEGDNYKRYQASDPLTQEIIDILDRFPEDSREKELAFIKNYLNTRRESTKK